jgi:hypothetical protein
MSGSVRDDEDLAAVWRSRFGQPPPIQSNDLMRAVLRDYAHAASAPLSTEAAQLEREAEAACAQLRAARESSRRLMAEARERLLQTPARLAEALA